MSVMDLFEDGFPHSTREGYERGCRGSACLGKVEHGFSCAEAYERSHGDYRYQRMVADGMSPAQIAEVYAAAAPPVKVKRKRSQREKDGQMHTVPSVTVADSEEPVVEKPKRVRAEGPKPKPVVSPERKSPVVVHGTPQGYGRGCRTVEGCPGGESGVTCRAAWQAVQREYYEARKAKTCLVEPKVRPGPEAKPIEHGTAKGYGRGCRDDCPGDASGVTCREAMTAYLREYKARRAANGGGKLGQAKRPAPVKPRDRKLAEVPVRVKVKCLPILQQQSPADPYKVVSYVLLRNGAVGEGKFHRTWAEAMEHAWSVVAKHREAAS